MNLLVTGTAVKHKRWERPRRITNKRKKVPAIPALQWLFSETSSRMCCLTYASSQFI